MRAKITILLLFLSSAAFAQFGAQFHLDNLSRTGNNSAQFNGYTIGIHYWFRLEKKRLEFQPTLAYQSINRNNSDLPPREYESLLLEFQTNFYPLDWFNDCKCPTFGKTNDFIKKGFFLTAAPLVGMYVGRLSNSGSRSWLWGVKAGAGLDIGIAQFLTITPSARLVLIPHHFYGGPELQDQTVFGYNLGLSATFRLDKKNYAF